MLGPRAISDISPELQDSHEGASDQGAIVREAADALEPSLTRGFSDLK
jgi:hypothetical protein